MEQVNSNEGVAIEIVSRVQWRAVFSGLAVAAGALAVCMGFSWALGLSTFQPTADHARGLTLGNVIWGAVALWIASFCGAYVAALTGRSTDGRSGVLHGLVVWGSIAGLLGFFVTIFLSGLMPALLRMSGETAAVPPSTIQSTRALSEAVQIAGTSLWLYWAGIVGGLVTSVVGGMLASRTERKMPRPIGVRVPMQPSVPQPVCRERSPPRTVPRHARSRASWRLHHGFSTSGLR